MESQPVMNSVVSSPSSSPKQIVEVHSPTTSRALIKKSDLNQQRPVLHKYSAEQVEVVYHRRSGAKEVVGNKRKKRLSLESDKTPSKSFSKKSSQSPPVTPSGPEPDDHKRLIGSVTMDANSHIHSHINSLILPLPQALDPCEDLMKEGGGKDDKILIPNSNITKSISEMNRLGLSFESLAVNMSDGEDESVGGFSVGETVEEESQGVDGDGDSELVSKISDLTAMMKKLSEDVLNMESRIKKLEVDSRAIQVDNSFLHERYVEHLQANSHVASDMKRIQSLLNSTSGISIMENEIEKLVKRVKRSNDGVEKVMYTNGNVNGTLSKRKVSHNDPTEEMELNDNVNEEIRTAGQTAHSGPNQ